MVAELGRLAERVITLRLSEFGPLIFIENSCILHGRCGLIALIYRTHLWLLRVVLDLFSQPYAAHMAILWAQQPTCSSLALPSLLSFPPHAVPFFSSAIHPQGLCLDAGLQPLTVPCWTVSEHSSWREEGEDQRSLCWFFSLCESPTHGNHIGWIITSHFSRTIVLKDC